MGHGSGTEAQLVSLFNNSDVVADASTLTVSLVFSAVVSAVCFFVGFVAVIRIVAAVGVVAVVGVVVVLVGSHQSHHALQTHTLAFRPASGVLLVDDLLESDVFLGSAVVLVVQLGVVSVVGVQRVGGDEVLGISDDAVSGGDEVGGLLAIERSTQTTNAVSEAVVSFDLDAASVVVQRESMAWHVDDHFTVGLSVDLSDSFVLVVGDFSNAVLGGSLFLLVDLDLGVGFVVVGGRGLHVDDVFAVVQDDLDVLLVLSGLFHQDGDVVLSLGLVVDFVVLSLFGSGGHQDVPGVLLKVQGVGLVVEGLSGGSVSNTHGCNRNEPFR